MRQQANTEKPPVDKMPVTSQHIWDLVLRDYEEAELRLEMVRRLDGATPEDITRFERSARIRKAVCNIVDFLITNKNDIKKVMAARKTN
jgi:hypothetical protein